MRARRPLGIAAAVITAVVAVAGCTSPPRSGGWEHEDDGARPSVGDTSECRIEAQRRAEIRYPPPPREQAGRPWSQYDTASRFPAEIGFYRECLQRKGFAPARQ